jgi:hypothetical protein
MHGRYEAATLSAAGEVQARRARRRAHAISAFRKPCESQGDRSAFSPDEPGAFAIGTAGVPLPDERRPVRPASQQPKRQNSATTFPSDGIIFYNIDLARIFP